ncbi:regulator of G protein signaling domain protein [Dictyocaulus viviparus]|uniref:Regulator of G protein signaling domain protein n=1 Tax=Dictyocaulus viviparus TaxID=29172 RepID=A0A0D8XLB0_DICVI|nr:regulator of G protein signaling domain protein [Dictyocaulus viviparus]
MDLPTAPFLIRIWSRKCLQQYTMNYEDEGYSYSEFDSDSSSDNSPSLPRFQLTKSKSDEKWKDKRILRKSSYGISRENMKAADSSSLSTIPSNLSSLLESTNEDEYLSDLYTPVQKSRHCVPPVFPMPQELSPVVGDSIDEPPCVPSLRLQRDWRPQQTSTTTSFQPFVSSLPKTNPHHGPKFVSSTPRTSAAGRIPMYSYNQIIESVSRPSSCYGEESCEYPAVVRSQNENVKPTFYRPENFGLPTGVAKNVGSEGILFLSMTLYGNELNVTINEGVYFQDPYQPQISSYVRVEMKRRCGNSRKRYYREKIQSYRTRKWMATNRPIFNEKFTFYIDEDNYFRDLLTISVYKLKTDSHQQGRLIANYVVNINIAISGYLVFNLINYRRMRMLGCMTFPVKRLMKKAREANDGYYIDENMTIDEVVVNEGGFFLLAPKRGERKCFPQNKISIKTYYNDKTFSGDGVLTTSSSCISNPSEIPTTHLRSNVTAQNDGSTVNDIYMHPDEPYIEFNKVAEYFHLERGGRATLPDITSTTENTSDGGIPLAMQTRRRKCGTRRSPIVDLLQFKEKRDQGLRRAASFTFSPKGASDKTNCRTQVQPLREDEIIFSGPISKTISLIRSKLDLALSTSSLYPTREEVCQWRVSFESLLNHKYGCSLFREFLKKEFSDENVDFWIECEEFRKMKEGKRATIQRAHEIFKEYVAAAAPKEVNLDSDTRAATKAALESGCKSDTFSLAQSRIEQLMAKDPYRRFLKDHLYLNLVNGVENVVDSPKLQK